MELFHFSLLKVTLKFSPCYSHYSWQESQGILSFFLQFALESLLAVGFRLKANPIWKHEIEDAFWNELQDYIFRTEIFRKMIQWKGFSYNEENYWANICNEFLYFLMILHSANLIFSKEDNLKTFEVCLCFTY